MPSEKSADVLAKLAADFEAAIAERRRIIADRLRIAQEVRSRFLLATPSEASRRVEQRCLAENKAALEND